MGNLNNRNLQLLKSLPQLTRTTNFCKMQLCASSLNSLCDEWQLDNRDSQDVSVTDLIKIIIYTAEVMLRSHGHTKKNGDRLVRLVIIFHDVINLTSSALLRSF